MSALAIQACDRRRPSLAAIWLAAIRPATLLAAVAPVSVGTAIAYSVGSLAWSPAIAALVGALLLQVGCNFANDVFDFEKGADTDSRLGPARAVQSGWISPATMRIAMICVFAAAACSGAYLASHSGWPVIAIGVASLIAAVAYTGGPYPLGYHGLGDLFVMIFFGFVAVCGTAFVQCGYVPAAAWWAAWPVGALASAILVVNNLRDRATDLLANKRTLAVRFGRRFAVGEYWFLILSAHLVAAITLTLYGSVRAALLPTIALPFAIATARKVTLVLEPRELNPLLGATARVLLLHSALLSAALCLGVAWP